MWFRRLILPLFLVLAVVPYAGASGSLKVMSWNLHHGAGLDGKIDLNRIADFIKKQEADMIVLQEVDNRCKRSGDIDQATEIAKLTGLHGSFGAAMPYDGGQYGLAILSKHPIGKTEVIRLPGSGEPRIGLMAGIQTPAGAITFVSTHFDHRSGENRIAQAKELITALEKIPGPIIVGGDLNDVPGSPALASFKEPWVHVKKQDPAATCPADHPKSEIDHFFVRGLQPMKEAEVLEEVISSDHRPIIATLAIVKP